MSTARRPPRRRRGNPFDKNIGGPRFRSYQRVAVATAATVLVGFTFDRILSLTDFLGLSRFTQISILLLLSLVLIVCLFIDFIKDLIGSLFDFFLAVPNLLKRT